MQEIKGQIEKGHLLVYLDAPAIAAIQDALEKRGGGIGISYRKPTGCGLEGGFDAGDIYQHEEGLRRGPHVLSCKEDGLLVNSFEKTKPEFRAGFFQILEEAGYKLIIDAETR